MSHPIVVKTEISQPKVSVIINVHNGEKYIEQTVIAILNQTFENFELIVFDNFSSDNTTKKLKSIKDDRLKIHSSESLIPLYSARNMAVKETKGNFIAFCDADDLWFSTKLEEQISTLEKTGDMLVCTNFLALNERDGGKEYSWVFNKLPRFGTPDLIMNEPYVHLSSLMIDRRMFLEHGVYFDDNLDIIGDMDFCVRALKFSKISVIDNFLTIYRYHGENIGFVRYQELADEGLLLAAQYRKSMTVDESVLLKFEKRMNWIYYRQKVADGESIEFGRAIKILGVLKVLKICVLILLPNPLIRKISMFRNKI